MSAVLPLVALSFGRDGTETPRRATPSARHPDGAAAALDARRAGRVAEELRANLGGGRRGARGRQGRRGNRALPPRRRAPAEVGRRLVVSGDALLRPEQLRGGRARLPRDHEATAEGGRGV